MSYYDVQSWQSPTRPASWDQPAPPSRSGTSSTMQQDEIPAFGLQMEEVERAIDNLTKSGKLFGAPGRRDSMPLTGASRTFSEFDPRMGSAPQRHHSVTDFDPMRSHSASNLQNFYANQRYQPRHSEAEQMQQAKRRMAAQRERELRNYHQEQQYNRQISTQNKPERSISPNMNEEDRRELIARQHRALYGNDGTSFYDGNNFGDDNHTPRPGNTAPGAANSTVGGHFQSSLAYNSFGVSQEQNKSSSVDNAAQYSGNDQSNTKGPSPQPQQARSRANSTSSPASNNQSFSLFDGGAQQSSRTSTSSPGGSPPRQSNISKAPGAGVAPIGTRPSQGQAANPALNKCSTTPLPSPLSYGFAPNETSIANNNANERSTSAASNPSGGPKDGMNNMNWGSSSGVWGKNPLGVQASVWG